MTAIRQKIEEKLGSTQVLETLAQELSLSELTSFFLELFQKKVTRIQPGELVRQYAQNRFVAPARVGNPLKLKALELDWLTQAEKAGFEPVILSPVAPLGSCAVVAPVHQNNVLSATRGTEVVADATNMLALLIARHYKNHSDPRPVKYATTHRHVRGQAFDNPAYSAHFAVFCMATGGLAQADFQFELMHVLEHLRLHLALLSDVFSPDDLSVRWYLREDNLAFQKRLEAVLEETDWGVAYQLFPAFDKGDYYQMVQFKVFLAYKTYSIDLADGGLVDWTQKLVSNQKHRLCISGCGIEIVHKIQQGMI